MVKPNTQQRLGANPPVMRLHAKTLADILQKITQNLYQPQENIKNIV